MPNTTIILASSSKARQQLLAKYQVPFTAVSPDVVEEQKEGELAQAMVHRLSSEKAQAVQTVHPQHIIIGGDQVAECNTKIYGKPLNYETALQQLKICNNKTVTYHTGVTVLSPDGTSHFLYETTSIKYKNNPEDLLIRYLEKEQPFEAAMSFKSETLAMTLLEKFSTNDPTAILGIPMLQLCSILSPTHYHPY